MDSTLRNALCSIRDGEDTIVGTGFLVGSDLVCTCAHVVQLSQGLPGTDPNPPPGGVDVGVRFDSLSESRPALVETWGPSVDAGCDLALLKLTDGSPPEATPIKVMRGTDLSGAQFVAFGFPVGRDEGRYAYGVIRDQLADGMIQLEATSSQGIRIAGGFSGSPVLLPDIDVAVGVLVSVDTDEAARTALAMSSEALASLGIEVEVETVSPTPAQKYVGRLRAELDRSYSIPEPNLDITASWGEEIGEASNTLIAALASAPRAALHAPAGAGKSGVVGRLARSVSDQGEIAVVLNLKLWTLDSSGYLAGAANAVEKLDVVLALSIADVDANGFQALQDGGVVYFIADGLNEVSGSEALRGIMQVLETALRSHPDTTRALIVDRGRIGAIASLTERWSSVDLNPLDPQDVTRVIDARFGAGVYDSLTVASKDLLSAPYFLHQALNTGQPELGSRLSALRGFFEQEVHLGPEEIALIGRVAFEALKEFRSYSFPVAWYEGEVDEALRAKLATGVFRERAGPDSIQFNHQLKHDFMVATRIANNEDLWTAETFDVATFETQSLEVLGLTLEQLDSADAGDRFMARVYDWSYPAALHCLGRALSVDQEPASPEMRTFLLAVTTEKRWDPVTRSGERTVKSLEALGEAAEPYLACGDLAALIDLVAAYDTEVEWFLEWRQLFAIVGQPVPEQTVQLIQSADGRVGWTLSNVLRRFDLADQQQTQLRAIFRANVGGENRERATVRWRTIHALGESIGEESRNLLFEGLDDPDMWVSYGAVRALVEMASQSDGDLRQSILEGITNRLEGLAVRVVEELGSCVFLTKVPKEWGKDVLPVLEAVLATKDTDAEKEQWAGLIERFQVYVEGDSTG